MSVFLRKDLDKVPVEFRYPDDEMLHFLFLFHRKDFPSMNLDLEIGS